MSLNVHILALPLGRDRLAERDCKPWGGSQSAHGTRTVGAKEARHTIGRALGEKRPQDATLRLGADRRVVERVDERCNAENVRKLRELLADRGARLPGAGQKLDGGHPVLWCDPMAGGRNIRSKGIFGRVG